jgi:hypothetical protein
LTTPLLDCGPVTDEAAELARAWFANSPFINELGLELVALETDLARRG